MSEVVLLGAGASVEAGVPHAYGLTEEIYSYFRHGVMGGDFAVESSAVVGLVIGGLRFQRGLRNDDVSDARVNVEDLFNAVEMLGNRNMLEAAPFVGTWHPIVSDFDTLYARDVRGGYDWSDRQKKPWEGAVFQRTNERMIRVLAQLVWVTEVEKIRYLSPLLRLLQKQADRLVVASLNYDNTVECMARANGSECQTGIDGWSESGELDLSGKGLHLLKLHGSIDWALEDVEASDAVLMPHRAVRQLTDEEVREAYAEVFLGDAPQIRPAIIFGGRNKLTADGPFLDILRAFRQELHKEDVDTLTVIGYAFRDPHVNVNISRWLNRSDKNTIRIVDPYFEESPESYAADIKKLRASRPDRVQVIKQGQRGCGAGEALAMMYGPQL
jgi:hypothetical protein